MQQDMGITSKDVDFYQRSMLRRVLPKISGIQIGSGSTAQAAMVLRRKVFVIQQCLQDSEAAFLRLG
jgi:predicted nuclease of predicted toxin-antitoxin system